MIKILSKLRIEVNFLNLINIYIYTKNRIANITFNDEKLEAFLLRSGARQECSLSPLLFNPVVEVLANAVRKGYKRHTDWEGRNKTVFVRR